MARRVKFVLQAVAVLVVASLVALLGWRVAQQEEGRGLDDALAAGKRPAAPEFTLDRLDGEGTISLADYRGKAVVVNFWASWCGPCKTEAPLLQDAWERYREQGLVVLGVDAQDLRSDGRRFVERYGITYPVAHDGGVDARPLGGTGFPRDLVRRRATAASSGSTSGESSPRSSWRGTSGVALETEA